ncbi:MAG TPA: hypothetical protein VG405_00345 [Solirubrobacteraceae bacterium]|nr:hypothetical protein [Solirubrobacteraceae bacterium]
MASLPLLLYQLVARYLPVTSKQAVAAAIAGSIYPAVTTFSQVALSENALLPLTCVWLLLVADLFSGSVRPMWVAVLFGACSALMWAIHGRMVVALGLALVAAVRLLYLRRIKEGGLLLAVLLGGAGGVQALNAFLIAHNYAGSATDGTGARLSAIFGFHPLVTVLENLVGQSWYLVVSTFGLTLVLARLATGRADRTTIRGSPPLGPLRPWLLALTGGLLLVSAAAFPTRTRPDMFVYGRYVEVVCPPLVTCGLAWLPSSRPPFRWTAAVIVLLTAAVAVIRVVAVGGGAPDRWDVSALPFLTFDLGAGVLGGAGLVALVGARLLLLPSSRRRVQAPVVVMALFLPVIAYTVWNPVITSQRAVYPSGWQSPQTVASKYHMRVIDYDLANYDVIGLYVTQWFLPHTHVMLINGSHFNPADAFVFAAGNRSSTAHPGYSIVWRDAGRDQVLWANRANAVADAGRSEHAASLERGAVHG